MNFYLFVCTLLYGAAAMFGLIHHAHMLQQNSYFPSRYLKWVKTSFPKGFFINLFAVSAAILLAVFEKYLWLAILAATTLFIKAVININGQKKAIKPLKFTARIKRYFASGIIVFLLLTASAFLFDFRWPVYAAIAGCCCPPFTVLLLWAITYPAERLIAQYYISDAKKKLKRADGLKVIGVTGSFGKTGVKLILNELLIEKYNVLATPQSYNTPMGVVRTVREQLRRDTQVFVCEMGAKNKGDIKTLCNIAHPTFGVITSVGEQHLETFKTPENVADTKFELADYCVKKKNGTVFVNFDSPAARKRAEGLKVISYGTAPDCDFLATEVKTDRYGSSFTIAHKGGEIPVSTRLLGRHNVLNITASAAVAYTLGVPDKDISFAVSRIKPAAHRLEPKPYIKGSLMIDDAYNANPEGCLEAVRVLSCFDGMKKVIITPGLVELGDKERECNEALAKAAARVCDVIILVGKKRAELMEPAITASGFDTKNLYIADSFANAANIYSGIASRDTVVLIENDLPDNYLG